MNEEVIDFAVNVYGTLNIISQKYSPDAVVDVIPIVINILNRLDAALKVNADLTNTIQELCEENVQIKKLLTLRNKEEKLIWKNHYCTRKTPKRI